MTLLSQVSLQQRIAKKRIFISKAVDDCFLKMRKTSPIDSLASIRGNTMKNINLKVVEVGNKDYTARSPILIDYIGWPPIPPKDMMNTSTNPAKQNN